MTPDFLAPTPHLTLRIPPASWRNPWQNEAPQTAPDRLSTTTITHCACLRFLLRPRVLLPRLTWSPGQTLLPDFTPLPPPGTYPPALSSCAPFIVPSFFHPNAPRRFACDHGPPPGRLPNALDFCGRPTQEFPAPKACKTTNSHAQIADTKNGWREGQEESRTRTRAGEAQRESLFLPRLFTLPRLRAWGQPALPRRGFWEIPPRSDQSSPHESCVQTLVAATAQEPIFHVLANALTAHHKFLFT